MADQTQNDAVRAEMLSRSTASSGSATGQAKDQASGKEDERLEGQDKRPGPKDGPTNGDFALVEYAQPIGLQAEPANFTSGGTIPASMVSSPSGFVPISSIADPEEAQERTLGAQGSTRDDRALTEEELGQLDGPSIRAIGAQRGYKINDLAGKRTVTAAFLAAQGEDKRFTKGKK